MTGNSDQITHSAFSQERKYRRFNLCYPVLLQFPPGGPLSEVQAVTKNVSIGGLLLDVPSRIPQYSSVSFTMTVQGERLVRPILLVGEGTVVRVEPQPGQKFAVAVECSRPMIQMSNKPSPRD